MTRYLMFKTAKLYTLLIIVLLMVTTVGCRTHTAQQPAPPPPTAIVAPSRPTATLQSTPALIQIGRFGTATPIVQRGPVGTSTPASGLVRVDAGDNFYYPDVLTVKVGTTVRWMHVGQTAHDVTARDKSWGIQLIPLGGYFDHTFRQVGEFDYYCIIHNPAMTGKVIVVR